MKTESGIPKPPMTGAELIVAERERQMSEEGFDAEHDDDAYHRGGELALAAACYAAPVPIYTEDDSPGRFIFTDAWPHTWEHRWDKRRRGNWDLLPNRELPVHEQIRNLVKAGALIAAEIDRLQRMK